MRPIRLAMVLASGLLVVAGAAQADDKKPEMKAAAGAEKKMQMPKPGPEVKKLGYFAGTWKTEGEMKENPFGMPAGKITSTDKCAWFKGGFHLVCTSTGTGPMGTMKGLGFMAYNSEEKVYTYSGIDSTGFTESSKGKVDGNKWVYTSAEKMGGKTIHGRYSMETASPDSYTFKYETSADGNQWALVMDGTCTREKAAEKKK